VGVASLALVETESFSPGILRLKILGAWPLSWSPAGGPMGMRGVFRKLELRPARDSRIRNLRRQVRPQRG
jgi:hypothetical protein